MRMLATAVAVTALMTAASAAVAATATGAIKDINAGKDFITLNTGKTIMAPKSAELNTFSVGERVHAYNVQNGQNDATKIAPVKWSDASLGRLSGRPRARPRRLPEDARPQPRRSINDVCVRSGRFR